MPYRNLHIPSDALIRQSMLSEMLSQNEAVAQSVKVVDVVADASCSPNRFALMQRWSIIIQNRVQGYSEAKE